LTETAGKVVQVVPSSEYAHVPAPVVAVTASPATAEASTSLLPRKVDTTADRAVSMSVEVSVGVVSVTLGASLALLTTMEAPAVLVENAVVPPAVVVSTVAPALPEVWSQARTVRVAVSPLLPSGT